MIKVTAKEACSGCYACKSVCPKNCITMNLDEKGFFYPSVDKKVCINCGRCEKVCPMLNIKENNVKKNSYAAFNRDETIRMLGSSGGLFGALAGEILRLGGVVFGASFDADCKSVKHIVVERSEDLEKVFGSKYLQSEIGDSLKLAKEYLDKGRFVLFSGTSCQINGLKLFLNKDYEKLITVDVICHGVPSPMVWADYIKNKEAKYQARVISAKFREKRLGWQKSVLLLLLSDGIEYFKPQSEDEYIRGFLGNLYLRDSCYFCRCKGKYMMSDITLGDFWGVEKILPDINVDNGVSAVIINTEKGREAFNQVRQNLQVIEVSYDDILKGNPSLEHSVNKPDKSEVFWELYKAEGLDVAFKKTLHPSFLRRSCRLVKKIYKGFYRYMQKESN